jgi:hypothetical protein
MDENTVRIYSAKGHYWQSQLDNLTKDQIIELLKRAGLI